MATSPITCPNCGYKNYHPEATACEQCYAPLKPTAGSDESAGTGEAKPAPKAGGSKPAARAKAAPPSGGSDGVSPVNAVLYLLALPLSLVVAIGAAVSGARQREIAPGVWLLGGSITLSAWLLAWYAMTGEGSAAWLVWPPVVLFVSALFGGILLVRTGEPTPGLVALATGLTGLAVYGGLSVMEPTPESMVGHSAPINAIAVTPAGNRMVSGDEDGNVHFWDLTSGKSQAVAAHEDGVASVLWAPNSAPLTIDYGGKVKVWNLDASPPTSASWEAGQGLSCVAISRTGTKIAVGTLTGNVDVRNAKDGEASQLMLSGGEAVTAVTFGSDANSVAVGQISGEVAVYGTLEARYESGPQEAVGALAFSGSDTLAVGYKTGEIRLWNIKTGEETAAFTGPEFPVRAIAVRGSTLVALFNNRSVVRWDLNSKSQAGSTDLPANSGRSGGPPSQVSILPSGDLLVANGRTITRVWAGSLKE